MVARLRTNNSGVRNKHWKGAQIKELCLDIKFWVVFFIAFLSMIANGPISTFAPLIIRGMGFSGLKSLLLFMPAGAYAGTLQLIFPFIAYKYPNSRAYLVMIAQAGTTLAALLLWKLPMGATGGLLFAIYILPTIGAGYAPADAPRYAPGFIVVVVTSIVAGILAGVYRILCVMTNKSRDKAGTMEAFDNAYEDDLTDVKNPQFRYTL
ncbi:unnamed protein product [Parascedosporium putredinis]|uniref:Uncharacterized protein n=1 Tax=Parascedosporium putredinis TaxID=1442378 RepID=A0A9P1GXT6_9PEZI|nr:unnamed protein product [Parascedosporium putredinis]CAI7990920.1 unnamed protein product [Parascedosporium putredinis]